MPVFAGFPAEMRAAIAAQRTLGAVPAGEWLMRQGEPGDSLYVVRSGRLEIVLERPREEVLRVLTRGAVVGELALITGSPRSASVRARRDSELLKLERGALRAAARRSTRSSRSRSRASLAASSSISRGLPLPAEALPGDRDAVVGLGRCRPRRRALPRASSPASSGGSLRVDMLDAAAEGLAEARLRERARPLRARARRRAARADRLATRDDGWTEFCLRQADRVLALAAPRRAAFARSRATSTCAAATCSRAATVRASARPRAWIDSLAAALASHRCRRGDEFSEAVAAIARRLAGRSIGIVLSGGGARGFAHIGVLDELRSAGVVIDRVGGCSMGAFVGAMFAVGMPAEEMRGRCRQEFVERSPLSDYTVPTVSLVRGNRAERDAAAHVRRPARSSGCRASSSASPATCSAASWSCTARAALRGGRREHVPARRSSRRWRSDGHLLVDGGVLNNLPVEPMAATAEGPVIASDVTAAIRRRPPRPAVRRRGAGDALARAAGSPCAARARRRCPR